MGDLILRPAEKRDLPDLLELYAELHPRTLPPTSDEAARILEEFSRYRGSAVFLGLLRARPVSTCALVVVPNLTRGGMPFALIENVVTAAAHRGRDFARQVLRHAVSAAWERGCYKVMLMTGATDPAILRFYEGTGFERSKTGFQIRRVPERASGCESRAPLPAEKTPNEKIECPERRCHWISTLPPVEYGLSRERPCSFTSPSPRFR